MCVPTHDINWRMTTWLDHPTVFRCPLYCGLPSLYRTSFTVVCPLCTGRPLLWSALCVPYILYCGLPSLYRTSFTVVCPLCNKTSFTVVCPLCTRRPLLWSALCVQVAFTVVCPLCTGRPLLWCALCAQDVLYCGLPSV